MLLSSADFYQILFFQTLILFYRQLLIERIFDGYIFIETSKNVLIFKFKEFEIFLWKRRRFQVC